MTNEEINQLTRKYGLTYSNNTISYKNFIICYIRQSYHGFCADFIDLSIYNPIAVECKFKNTIKKLKLKELENKLNSIKQDF